MYTMDLSGDDLSLVIKIFYSVNIFDEAANVNLPKNVSSGVIEGKLPSLIQLGKDTLFVGVSWLVPVRCIFHAGAEFDLVFDFAFHGCVNEGAGHYPTPSRGLLFGIVVEHFFKRSPSNHVAPRANKGHDMIVRIVSG